jgi:hypothetical protein
MIQTLLAAIVAAVLAAAAVIAAVLIPYRRSEAAMKERESQLRGMRADLKALCTGALGLGERIAGIEKQMRGLGERLEQLELREAGNRPYAQAIRLVQDGSGIDDLMATGALTRGEAELLVMLHQQQEAEGHGDPEDRGR